MELNSDKMARRSGTEPRDREMAVGWRLILASALGVGFGSIGFATYAIGAFIDPLGKEFGWTRAEVQGAIAFGVGLGGFAAPIVGILIVVVGLRRSSLTNLRLSEPLADIHLALTVTKFLISSLATWREFGVQHPFISA